ncbi:uncharacterized protein ACBT44_006652 [Syngnathus typhle]
MDELLLLTSRNTDFSRSAALCFVETWLSERTPHHAVELAGFKLMRADRSAELSGKSKGGGVCFYINERWCTDVTVLKEFCSPLLETLFINCRPFYSPREFSSIVMAAVYIPPHARASEATQMLADQVTDMEKLLPNSLIIVLGDLNRANLAHELPRYRQHVTCPTRGAQTLDHCYTVIKDAYHSAARAALGLSDHCLVHLIPAYRQKLKTSKPVVRTVRKWTVESRQDLQACFDCTDWGAFEAATSDLHELTDTVTSYISFCEDLCVQTKTFCTYNNDKPWFTPNLRRLRKVKEEAYRSGDRELFRQTRNTLNREVRKARRCYGENLKRHLSANPDPSTVWKEAAPALQVREEEVRQMFRRQKTRKAPGPDGVSPSCLKVCAEQLAPTFARIFNRSLELCERLVLNHLKEVTGPLLDPLQFAYRANRSVDDAVNMGLHYILHHLDTPGTYARILFVDFSSAFNTIAPDILQQKLIQLAVPASTCQWITSFLTNRRQRVRLGGITSDTRTTNTGAPQGCVLSPLLFSLYTNDFSSGDSPVKLLKYADDTTLIGLIQDGDETAYRQEVERLVHWCSQNHLELNSLKTVEMTVDFRRDPSPLLPLTIRSNTILSTDTFNFLGTTISRDLKWTGHIDSVRKKAQQRLYFLRQLKKFNLPRELLKTFYTAIIQSVLCTSITVWFGSASKQDKHRLQRTIRTAEKIIGINLPSIQDLYLSRTRNRARNISTDPSHPGCSLFELLPSGRRYRARYAKTSRHRDSFFPQAVALMNSHHS